MGRRRTNAWASVAEGGWCGIVGGRGVYYYYYLFSWSLEVDGGGGGGGGGVVDSDRLVAL